MFRILEVGFCEQNVLSYLLGALNFHFDNTQWCRIIGRLMNQQCNVSIRLIRFQNLMDNHTIWRDDLIPEEECSNWVSSLSLISLTFKALCVCVCVCVYIDTHLGCLSVSHQSPPSSTTHAGLIIKLLLVHQDHFSL